MGFSILFNKLAIYSTHFQVTTLVINWIRGELLQLKLYTIHPHTAELWCEQQLLKEHENNGQYAFLLRQHICCDVFSMCQLPVCLLVS